MLLLLILLAAPAITPPPAPTPHLKAAAWTDWSATLELRVSSDARKAKRMSLQVRADADGQQLRLDWHAPAGMRGMKFLAVAPRSGDDSWSMYLRPLRRVVPVPLSAANTYVRDMMNLGLFKPRPEHFTYTPTTTQRTVNKAPCTLFNGTPITPAVRRQFGFDTFTLCVNAAGQPVETEFLNDGKVVRRQTVITFTQTSAGPLPTHIRAVNLDDGITTDATLTEVVVNQGLKLDRFTRRALDRH